MKKRTVVTMMLIGGLLASYVNHKVINGTPPGTASIGRISIVPDDEVLIVHEEKPVVIKTEQLNQDDLDLLARLIYSEAGNQPYEGMLAVGTVVMNRVDAAGWYSDNKHTIEGVIFKRGQFDGIHHKNFKKSSKSARKAAEEVLKGYRSFGKEIIYFFNPDTSTDTKFMRSVKVVMRIGDHVFAKE